MQGFGCEMVSNVHSVYQQLVTDNFKSYEIAMEKLHSNTSVTDLYATGPSSIRNKADRYNQTEAIGHKMISNIPSAYEHLSTEMPKSNKIAADHLNIGSQSIKKEITMDILHSNADVTDVCSIGQGPSPTSQKVNRYSVQYDARLLILR
ncbi:hypothetical protein LIER_20993 [Lithospermum erythrorhizon]|uniref:Uncharacterized protein n=1 Tax=Lithospermum erythrorhizon TaxID=34254 RepID=A0AAV3QRQ3_LITER